jgi:HPt (histidine-containing phosphotransfer) domain-containing protein
MTSPDVAEPIEPSLVSAVPPIDYRALAELIGDDDENELRSIVLEYVATAGPTLHRAREALERRDPVDLADAAHAGKGSALNVCAGPLSAAWRALESAARAHDFTRVEIEMNELDTRFRDLTTGT